MTGVKLVGYIQRPSEKLNSGSLKKNAVSSKAEGLKEGPLDYKTSALTTCPLCLSYIFDICTNNLFLLGAKAYYHNFQLFTHAADYLH